MQRLCRYGHHIEPGTVDMQRTRHAMSDQHWPTHVRERTPGHGQRSRTRLDHDNGVGGWGLEAQSILDQHLVARDHTGLAAPRGDGGTTRELADPPARPVRAGKEVAHSLRLDSAEL